MADIIVLNGLDEGLSGLLEGTVRSPGLIYLADLSGEPSNDPWDHWVTRPTKEFLLHAGSRVRNADVVASVLVVRTRTGEVDAGIDARRRAAVESLRGTNGSIALERAPDQALANMVIIDETTTDHDIRHTLDYLLDGRYNGFTTGATIHLTGQKAADSTRRNGKVLITGGAGTIGFATARAYQDAGYEPVLTDLSKERLEESAAKLGGVTTYEIDLTDAEAVRELAATGDFADLTSVATVHGFQGSYALEDLTPELIEKSITINGTSVANVIDAFTPLLAQNSGSFAIVSSQAGIRAEAVTSAYSAPKFALVGLCQGLAPVLLEQGVSVNILAPGPVDTPLLRAYFERFAGAEGQDVDAIVAERSASMPLGRFAKPEEMANALRFLSQLDSTDVLLAPTGGETLT